MMSTRPLSLALALTLMTISSPVLSETQETYSKPDFGYQVEIPSDWSIYREFRNETEAIVSFGLPLV